MKAIIGSSTIEIHPNFEDVRDHCKIGQGAKTCMWLLIGKDGWECAGFGRPQPPSSGQIRSEKSGGKQNGCDKVNGFKPSGVSGLVEF